MQIGTVCIADNKFDYAVNWKPLEGKAYKKWADLCPVLAELGYKPKAHHPVVDMLHIAKMRRLELLREMDISESDILNEKIFRDQEGNYFIEIRSNKRKAG